MSNSEIYTDLPLIAQASGEEITKADETLLEDFSILPANTFIEKYGADTFQSMVNQREATIQAGANALAAGSRGWDQAIQDTAKNIISGAITGVTGAASLVTTPIRPLSEGLARATRGINEFSQSIGSDAEKAQRALHEFKQKGLKARIDREIREAEAGGKSVSLFEKISKEYGGSLVNLFETGQISEIASSGIGSLLVGGPMTKGITKAASFVGSKAPGLANAIDKVAKQNATVAKIKDAAPWMTSMGLQEGGGTYGDMLLNGLDIPTEELMANSPEFQTLYKEYRANNLNHDKAVEEAKRDLAFAAAREAGALTALGAGAANYLTAGLGRGIEKAGLLKSTVSPFIKNADEGLDKFVAESFSEPIEEGISEGLGQFASNLATQRHIDKNQKLDEDIGQSIAEGMAGGLGVTGLRIAPHAVDIASRGLELGNKGINKAQQLKHDWEISEKRSRAFADSISKSSETLDKDFKAENNDFKAYSDNLNTFTEEVFAKDSDGNPTTSSERLASIFQELDENKEVFKTASITPTEDKKSQDKLNKFAKHSDTLINSLKENIHRILSKRVQTIIDSKSSTDSYTDDELNTIANTLAISPRINKWVQNVLPKHVIEQLKGITLPNAKLDEVFKANLKPTVEEEMANTFANSFADSFKAASSNEETVQNPEEVFNSEPDEEADISSENSFKEDQPQKTSTPKVEDIIIGRGKDTWKDPNVNEVRVGGTDRGSKYEEGILTRPGTAPDKWNGQNISDIRDPKGGTAIGKFYSENGSEYVYTNTGMTRRVKFYDSNTNGKDAGVSEWHDTVFMEKDDPLYELLSHKNSRDRFLAFPGCRFDPSTGKLMVQRTKGGEWTPFKLSDAIDLEKVNAKLREMGTETFEDHEYSLPKTKNEPKKGRTLVEFIFDENGNIKGLHASGGIGYVENSSTSSAFNLDDDPEGKRSTTYYRNEDGSMEPYDSGAIQKSFKEILGESLAKFFKVVRRPFHLWNANRDVADVLFDVLKDKESFLEYVRANKFTNAEALANSLFFKNGKLDDTDNGRVGFNPNDTVANQIRSLLRKGSPFRKAFKEVIYPAITTLKGNEKTIYKDTFYSDGQFNDRLEGICLITVVDALAKARAYRHKLNTEELEKKYIDLNDQDPDFLVNSARGVIMEMFTQNVATSLRKFIGVAPSNRTSTYEIDSLFGTLATKIVGGMIDANLLSVEKLEFKKYEYNKNTHKRELVTDSLNQIVPHPDFNKLFGPVADIFERIFNPNYKTSWHKSPPPVSDTIAHTDSKITKAQYQNLEQQNSIEYGLNLDMVKVISFLGGVKGVRSLFNTLTSKDDRNISNIKDFISRQGQELTDELGENLLKELILGNLGKPLEAISWFYNNKILKNGRTMQEGSATFQSSKFVRTFSTLKAAEKIDLSNFTALLNNKDSYKEDSAEWNAYLITLAQNFGISMNKNSLFFKDAEKANNLKESLEDCLIKLSKLQDSSEFGPLIKAMFSTDPIAFMGEVNASENTAKFEKLIQYVNSEIFKGTKFKISNQTQLPALIEVLRLSEASRNGSNLKNFQSNLLCEIDGISDGPSNINAICSRAASCFSPAWISNHAKTGNFWGIAITTQEIAENADLAAFLGISEPDFHAEVAYRKISEYVLKRIIALNNSGNTAAINTYRNIFTIFKAIGWLDGDIDAALNIKSLPKDVREYPIHFSREISKKLVTIIPYGSRAKGSMDQLASFMFKGMYGGDGIYSLITKGLHKLYGDSPSPSKIAAMEAVTALKGKKHYIFDVETNTKNINDPRAAIVQIAVQEVTYKNGKKVLGAKKTWFLENFSGKDIEKNFGTDAYGNNRENPMYKLHKEAKNKVAPDLAFKQFFEFIGNNPIVGQNVKGFDIPLIERLSGRKFDNTVIDTLMLSRRINEFDSHSVANIASNFNIKIEELEKDASLHDARTDVAVTYQILDKMLEASEQIVKEESAKSKVSAEYPEDFNGVSFREVMNSLESIFQTDFREGQFTLNPKNRIKEFANSFFKTFPSLEELQDPNWYAQKNGVLHKLGDPNATDIRNFEILQKGLNHISDIMVPLIGEPAQAAVTDLIGNDGLAAERYLAAAAGLMNILKQGLANWLTHNNVHGVGDLSQTQLHKLRNILRKVAPEVELPGGVKYVVQKEAYSSDVEPIYEDTSLGIAFYPSTANIESVSVSGGALGIQAGGDATMVMETFLLIESAITQVYDGIYSPAKNGEKVQEKVNQASYYAQQQALFNSIEDKLQAVGKNLINLKIVSKSHDWQSAIIASFKNLANGNYINGKKKDNSSPRSNNIASEILRYIAGIEEDPAYEPDLDKYWENKLIEQHNRDNSKDVANQSWKYNVDSNIETQLAKFFAKGEMYALNESVNLDASKFIPKAIQHMSTFSSTYKVGDPLSYPEAKELLNTVNKLLKEKGFNKFNSWPELISAYLNHRAREIMDSWLTEKKVTQKQYNDWLVHTKRAKANDGTLDSLPSDVVQTIADKFNIDERTLPKFVPNNKKDQRVVLNIKHIYNILDTAAKRTVKPALFKNIFGKVMSLLPKNTEVVFVSSLNQIPSRFREKLNGSQLGAFGFINGVPTIYIVDSGAKMDIYQAKNSETLCHEAIHAVLSLAFHDYYNKGGKTLTDVQKKAIDNLEELLKDFLAEDIFDEEGTPWEVKRLKEILEKYKKNPAKQLDESLAYIFANQKVFNFLATYKLKNNHKHHSKAASLLGMMLKAAKKCWTALLKIVAGSAVEKVFTVNEETSTVSYKKDVHSFLELYGINTLGLLNEDTNPDEGTKKRREDREKINSDLRGRAMFSLQESENIINTAIGRMATAAKNLKESISNRVKNRTFFSNRSNTFRNWGNINKSFAKEEDSAFKEVENYKQEVFEVFKKVLKNPDDFSSVFVELQAFDAMTPVFRDKLDRIYQQLKDRISPQIFVKDWNTATKQEKESAEILYDLLTGNHPLWDSLETPKDLYPKFREQAAFFALVITDDIFNSNLGKLKFAPMHKTNKTWFSNPLDALEEFANEYTQHLDSKEFEGKSVREAVKMAFADQQEYANPASNNVASTMDIFFRKMDRILVKSLLFPFTLVSSTAKELSKTYDRSQNIPSLDKYSLITEAMRSNINKIENLKISEYLKDFYGRTGSNSEVETLLKRIKGWLDKARHLLLKNIPENLTKAFKRKVDFKLKNFLACNFGAIDVSSFTFNEISEYLTDHSKVDAAISRILQSLEAEAPEAYQLYDKKVTQLAEYIMGKEDAAEILLTNAYAIARLPKSGIQINLSNISSIEAKIHKLITLRCIQLQEEGDVKLFKDLFNNDSEGMLQVYNQIVAALDAEDERLAKANLDDKAYLYNRMHGWIPDGDRPTGHYAIVSKTDFEKSYKSKGYKKLAEYDASNLDSSEVMYEVYCNYPHQKEYQEGILQSINLTGFGYQILNGTRGEATGARVLDGRVVQKVKDNLFSSKKKSGLNLIPVWSQNGNIIGFERSIPKESRKYLNKDKDLFSGIAQYFSRQERENLAQDINTQAIKLAYKDYINATPAERNKEFIDVLNTDDLAIQQAVARLTKAARAEIKDVFNGDQFYLRRDLVWTYLGYQRLSLTDMWDNQFIFPKAVENAITRCLDMLFKVVGLEGRYAVGLMESFLMGTVTWVRDTIIVRSLVVPAMNAIANIFLLHTSLGIPLKDIVRLYKENIIDTLRYNRLYKKELDLRYQMANAKNDDERRAINNSLTKVIQEYSNISIYKLIKEGEYSSISTEGTTYEELELFKQKPEPYLNSLIEKYPGTEKFKKGIQEILITKNSVSYRTLAEFVNMSDWIAKATAYRYLTEASKEYRKPKLNHNEARNIASILFVDFDQFVGRERDWTNRIGATWFMTYKYRMIPAALLSLLLNPTRMIFGTLIDGITGLGTPLTENLFSKVFSGEILHSLGLDMLFRGLLMHPLAVLTKFAV